MLDIRAGSRVGPYKIVAPLEEAARGGTSTLFLAQLAQVDGSQLVIVKLVPVEGEGGEGGGFFELNALRKEVEVLQKLRHPGIVKIYPIPSRDGRREHYISRATNVSGKPWYCALEHLGGGSLESRLQELTFLPLGEAVEIAYQIGSALDYMHAKGYVHWDIKPDNILFRHPWSENGAGVIEAVLTDFGIARSSHEPAVVAGSVRYMSPERLRVHLGEIPPDQIMDQRPADVYALGLVLYEMLAGDLPFVAEDMEGIKSAILEDTPIPLTDFNPEAPAVVEDIIFQALNKHPAARPVMEEMVTMLDKAVPAPRVGVRAPSIPGGEMVESGAVQIGVTPRRPAPPRPGEREAELRERRPSPAERMQQWALTVVAVGILVVGSLWVMGRTMGIGPLAPTPTPTAIPTEMPTETPTPTPVPSVEVISLSPASAMTGEGSVEITIVGENFQESADVFLSGTQGDIPATGVRVYASGSRMWCSFNISAAEPGVWSVLVGNPDGTLSELPGAFTIVAPTPTPVPTDTPTPTLTPTTVYRPPAATAVPPPPPTPVPQPSGGGGGPRPTKPPSSPPTISPP